MAEHEDDLAPEVEQDEDDTPLTRSLIARIMYAVETQDREMLWAEMEPLHAADALWAGV